MKYSKEQIISGAKKRHFIKENYEKVLRLTDILQFIYNDQFLMNKLVLKGGTAINLTVLNVPRLSVDIDLDYIGNIDKERTFAERPIIEEYITTYMVKNGYQKHKKSKKVVALSSMVFSYINSAGNNDNIKIDINYLCRCHILPLENRHICFRENENFTVLTLNVTELYASKMNALLSRSLSRDLYDIWQMFNSEIISDYSLLLKCYIFYCVISGDQNPLKPDFSLIEKLDYNVYKKQLKPLLSQDDKFSIKNEAVFVINKISEFDFNEEEFKTFVKLFNSGDFVPDILFNGYKYSPDLLEHPLAKWRIQHIKSS